MRERIKKAIKAWGNEATLAQIREKVDFPFKGEEAEEFYTALDGLVDEGFLIRDGMIYREGVVE